MERADAGAKLSELLASDLGVTRAAITPEARLQEDLGLDSLGMVELLLAMEEAFGVSIPDEEAGRIATVAEAVEAVLKLGGRHGRG